MKILLLAELGVSIQILRFRLVLRKFGGKKSWREKMWRKKK